MEPSSQQGLGRRRKQREILPEARAKMVSNDAEHGRRLDACASDWVQEVCHRDTTRVAIAGQYHDIPSSPRDGEFSHMIPAVAQEQSRRKIVCSRRPRDVVLAGVNRGRACWDGLLHLQPAQRGIGPTCAS